MRQRSATLEDISGYGWQHAANGSQYPGTRVLEEKKRYSYQPGESARFVAAGEATHQQCNNDFIHIHRYIRIYSNIYSEYEYNSRIFEYEYAFLGYSNKIRIYLKIDIY